jgi:acyl carrier protein
MDWRKYRRYYPRSSACAYLSRVTGALEDSSSGRQDRAAPVIQRGSENSPTGISAAGEARLIAHIAAVMQLDGDRIDRDRPLTEIGLDSIMALELENRIVSEWGIAVPMTVFLEGISTSRLVSLVMTRLAESEDGLRPSVGGIPAGRLEGAGDAGSSGLSGTEGFPGHVDQLSDTEVDNLLRMMLSREKPKP